MNLKSFTSKHNQTLLPSGIVSSGSLYHHVPRKCQNPQYFKINARLNKFRPPYRRVVSLKTIGGIVLGDIQTDRRELFTKSKIQKKTTKNVANYI